MKILVLSSAYFPVIGGGVRHVQSLSRELSKRSYQVTVCTMGYPGLPQYEEEGGVKIHRLGGLFWRIPFLFKDPATRFHPPAQDWLISRKLAEIIKREKPDVIHVHDWILYSVVGKRLRVPLVATLHDYGLVCPKKTLLRNGSMCDKPFTTDCIACGRDFYGLVKSLATYLGLKMNMKKLKSVDRFIAVGSFVKDVHVKHLALGDEDIVMIPNFCDPEIDRQREGAAGLPEDFILFVGAFSLDKGVNVLIEAFQKLDMKTKLVLIGVTHPDYHYKSTEGILVIENAPHDVVMQAMSGCRFAVFPSIWAEPFGIVAIEAMSQKKAVIASDMGGLKDIVVDGHTGILVPPNDSNKLAEAISYLFERPETASEMGQRGYERFVKNYTPDAVIPMIVDVYQSLL